MAKKKSLTQPTLTCSKTIMEKLKRCDPGMFILTFEQILNSSGVSVIEFEWVNTVREAIPERAACSVFNNPNF